MKTFSDPIKPRSQKPKEITKSPWDFSSPCYDNRSSSFIQAGTDYGVGFNQPVGHSGAPKTNVSTLPKS